MTPARQLRIVGMVAMVIGAVVTVVGAGCGIVLWKSGGTDNWLTGAAAVIVEWIAFLGGLPVAVAGWLFRRRSWVAEAAAVVAGSLVCLVGALECAFVVSWLAAGVRPVPAGTSSAFWALAAASFGAYMVALGIARGMERRDETRRPAGTPPAMASLRRLFARPLAAALTVAVVSLLGGAVWGAAHPDPTARMVADMRAAARSVPPPVDPAVAAAAWHACVASDKLDEYCGGATSIAIAPDARSFATAALSSPGHAISLWNRESGRRTWQTHVAAMEDPYQSIGVSPNGLYLYFATRTTGMLLSMADGKVVRSIERCRDPAHPPKPTVGVSLYGVAFAADAQRLAVGGVGICLFDVATGALSQRFAADSFGCDGEQLVFGASGAAIHAVCAGHIKTWDVRTGKLLGELPFGMRNDPARVEPNPGFAEAILAVSADDARMLTLNRDDGESLWLWSLRTQKELRVRRPALTLLLAPRVMLADSRRLLVGGSGLHVVDTETGKETKALLENRSVTAIAVAPGDAYVLVGAHIGINDRRPSITSLTESDYN